MRGVAGGAVHVRGSPRLMRTLALAEEEKLEPLRTVTDDPRIRLLNRLYARKRRELQLRKAGRTEPEPDPVRAPPGAPSAAV